MKKKICFWILLIAAAAFVYYYFFRPQEPEVVYRTVKIERGNLSTFVTANGTVNPVTTVLVGSQVSGTIQKLYADYNSHVKKGELIAQIDPANLQAQVSQAKAKVENARAGSLTAQADIATARSNVEASKANVIKARVTVEDSKRNLDRSSELFKRNLISASDRDTAQTAYDSAQALFAAAQAQQRASEAQLESANARLEAARAQIKQAEAELELAQVNLDHTKIMAPVNGIVISRNVDVGQTVAASLQAPTLFTIAQDLTEMQVEASVSEADIGRVAMGQETTFTVDAFPEITFKGKVTDIRNAPVTVQNVVTYNVVIRVRNLELKLKPGMTANASILVAHKEDVLKIPNAALRFRPDFVKKEAGTAQKTPASNPPPAAAPGSAKPNVERLKAELNLSPEQQSQLSQILQDARKEAQAARQAGPAGPEEKGTKAKEMQTATRLKILSLLTLKQKKKYEQLVQRDETRSPSPVSRVWIPVPQKNPEPIEITLGISDGTFTEVISGPLQDGQEVIVESSAGDKSKNSTPPPRRRGLFG